MSRSPFTLLTQALLVLVVAVAARAEAAGERPSRDFAVKAGKVITISGAELEPGVVVVRDGRFAAVGGADTKLPEGLEVIDAARQVLMPGFIEAHSHRGLDRTFETAPNASFVRVTDALNPVSLEIEDARRNGITTLLVAPDNQAFLAGRTAIVHPQGISVDAMIVKQDVSLKISLLPSGGASRMGHLARLREALDDTKRWMEGRGKRIAPRPTRARDGLAAQPEDDGDAPQRETLVALLQGKLPALVYCPTAADVAAAFALAREYGFHVTPVVGPDAWRAAELLRTNNVTVVVAPQVETWERQPDGSLVRAVMPKVLHDAGVPFALTTDSAELGAQHPWFQAALAVRAGVPRAEALAAITRVPARLLGFGQRKGVIEVGADADFLLLSDDPLSGKAWVDQSYVRGSRIYDRSEDEKLQRLLQRTSEPPIAAAETDHAHDEPEDPAAVPDDAERVPQAPAGAAPDELERRWPATPRTPR